MYSATKTETLKREYGGLFTSISEALFEADPAHLNFEVNTDEYETETGAIIARLGSSQSPEGGEDRRASVPRVGDLDTLVRIQSTLS
jgi:hypothetical protein